MLNDTGDGGGNSDYINIVGQASSLVELEAAFPASENEGQAGLVGSFDRNQDDALYVSDGVTWVKNLNDSDYDVGMTESLWNAFDGADLSVTDKMPVSTNRTIVSESLNSGTWNSIQDGDDSTRVRYGGSGNGKAGAYWDEESLY
jgi:hypothetical protein